MPGHAKAPHVASQDLGRRKLTCHEYAHLSKEDRYVRHQLAYHYARVERRGWLLAVPNFL